MKTLCVVLASSVFALVAATSVIGKDKPVVETTLGVVHGLWKTSSEGRVYASFEGIPYAKPPVGDLRFEEAQPAEAWSGIWNATKEYACVQPSLVHGGVLGSEDCLYINVYVPWLEDTKEFDVVAHIHGGAFMLGFGQQFLGVKYIMDRDLLLVTFNYRVGAFGFLSTENDVVPGNNGMKDQVLALKWIQNHIRSFGGNPNSVTLTGFSAGAASTHLHYFSPLSKGLFHRGMSMSGNALNPWAIKEEPLRKARHLSSVVGCDFESTSKMVQCLKTRPAELLAQATRDNLHRLYPLANCIFAPVVEKGSKQAFLSEHPYLLLKDGKVQDLPWITSFASDDGVISILTIFNHLNEVYENWTEFMIHVAEAEDAVPESKRKEIADKLKDFYLSNVVDNKTLYDGMVQLSTDRMFRIGTETAVQMQSKATTSPVYLYWFDFIGTNQFRFLKNPPRGVYHGDDMVYFFGGLISHPLTEREVELKKICMDLLERYAKTGVPALKGENMQPVGDELFYYKISGPQDIRKVKKDNYEANKLWSTLGFEDGEHLLDHSHAEEL